eukprot:SAG31_NODE_1259_length_9077_cov_3.520049_2_plen_54_part_00
MAPLLWGATAAGGLAAGLVGLYLIVRRFGLQRIGQVAALLIIFRASSYNLVFY